MPEYLAPAVYVEEIERGPKPIDGVSTSIAAFLGETERGPTMPHLVTSYGEYVRNFGGPEPLASPPRYMPSTVSSFFENGGTTAYIARITGAGATDAQASFTGFDAVATGPGDWGHRVFVKVRPSTTLVKSGATMAPLGFRIDIAYWTLPADGSAVDMADPFGPQGLRGLKQLPQLTETFDDVVFADEHSPNHYAKQVNGSSSLITLVVPDPTNPPPVLPVGDAGTFKWLTDDGAAGAAVAAGDFNRNTEPDPMKRTGLYALLLDPYRQVSLLYAPAAEPAVAIELIAQCEKQRFCFAVIDAAQSTQPNDASPRDLIEDTKYAAYYYPWIKVSDPLTGALKLIPPGGAVLGIYARSDAERGVFKAPANEVVRGAIDVQRAIDHDTQAILNPRGANVIRRFPGRGIRLWGARTMSSDALWKYVSVRRLFIFLEASIYEGTQWVVFEPNDEKLWARVRDTIRLFLRNQWREGALMGTTEAEAFRIACDRSTMTQSDILNGRLICEIGIAPVRPAEFVVFRLFQLTQEAQS